MFGDAFRLAQNNDRDYFEYIHNRQLDSNEANSLSDDERQFKAVCLTGDTGDEINYKHNLVTFKDGTTRWEIRFKAKDKFGNNSKFTDIYGDPFLGSRSEKFWHITNYPVAYSEVSYDKVSFRYGAEILVKQLADGTFIAVPDMMMTVTNNTKNKISSQSRSQTKISNTFSNQNKKLLNKPIEINRNTEAVRSIMDSLSERDKVFVFGDSQSFNGRARQGGITLGRTLVDYFKSRKFNILSKGTVSKSGAQPAFYIGNFSKIKRYLEDTELKLLFIFLGGNGPSQTKQLMDKIDKTIANKEIKIIWHGAPPPATDGTTYKYNKLFERRAKNNEEIIKHVDTRVTAFINPYDLSSFKKGYTCSDYKIACDGVHVPGPIALRMLTESGVIDEEYYNKKSGTLKQESQSSQTNSNNTTTRRRTTQQVEAPSQPETQTKPTEPIKTKETPRDKEEASKAYNLCREEAEAAFKKGGRFADAFAECMKRKGYVRSSSDIGWSKQ